VSPATSTPSAGRWSAIWLAQWPGGLVRDQLERPELDARRAAPTNVGSNARNGRGQASPAPSIHAFALASTFAASRASSSAKPTCANVVAAGNSPPEHVIHADA